eukprot:Phypoly_transcript_13340.p1 GENE.Phypoly_transcript_13340~~Phypoly_transcript_13340.p1  ORF type:complete len:274 (+),score=61.60 Phypoly_transcript_13340:156-977(+)
MEHAKKVLAASLNKEVKEEKPIKKPASLERKLADMKEKGIVPEPKRAKVEQPDQSQDKSKERELAYPAPPPYRDREARIPPRADINEPHPYYYREKPTQYPRRDEPVELTDEGEYYPTTIFVGDLTEDVTLPELENAFARFGEIDSLRPVAGKNFVFIKFKNRDASLRSIVEMNGFVINNVRLRVHRAKVSKGRFGGRRRFEGGDYPPEEQSNDPNSSANPASTTATEGAEQRTVEYNPTKFIPKIPKMVITPELQEQQQLLSSRTLRNYEDL